MCIKPTVLLTVFAFMAIACSNSSIEPIDQPPAPVATTLIYPENNTECNTGVEVDSERSTVNFQWNTSTNTDFYEIIIKELGTTTETRDESNIHEIEITLKKSTAYQWQVISKSNSSDEIATSEIWKFYNAGDGIVNHVPFPADVVEPGLGSNLDSNTTKVFLQWSASDIDNDINVYEVYFGTENPPTNSLGQTTDSNIEVDVSSGNIYHWMIKTIDLTNNVSESEVFWFKVN